MFSESTNAGPCRRCQAALPERPGGVGAAYCEGCRKALIAEIEAAADQAKLSGATERREKNRLEDAAERGDIVCDYQGNPVLDEEGRARVYPPPPPSRVSWLKPPRGPAYEPPPEPVQCPICRGYGWLAAPGPDPQKPWQRVTVACTCAEAQQAARTAERLKAWTEMSPALLALRFEGWMARPHLDEAWRTARLYANGELREKWLVLTGPPGAGKTHLGCAVLNWRREHREDGKALGKYVYAPDLLADLREGFSDHTSEERFERYMAVPLLLLDDLGQHNATMWAQEQLGRLLDRRYRERAETVITLSVAPQVLPRPIADRLMDTGTGLVKVVTMAGPSYRSGR